MKKTLLPIALCAMGLVAQAQLVPTTYRGAFAPAPATPWTEGWTSWTANANTYPATTDNVPAGEITTNTTWTKDKVYNLLGYTFVTNGATLTIEPGTVIRSTAKSALVITRGAKIYANGTKAEPIIFTSNNGIGTRAAGNWGGIVICGAAQHNLASGTDAKVEGDIDARHGGSDDQDSSGVFRYVRIEFPGQALTTQANSELNGLSMYSVGSKTKIEYVQVTNSGDDAFEWFGGTVNAKYLVAINTLDDDFDTDNGYRGTVQFGLSQKNPLIADQSGSNGFESDNDANGSLRTPVTAPTFSNITLVGPQGYTSGGSPVTPAALFANAAHIRRNSSTSIINSILIGYTESGLSLDGRRTVANAVNGTLKFTNNYVANNELEASSSNFRLRGTADTMGITSSTDVQVWALNIASPKNELGTDITANLTNPFTFQNPDFRPKATTNNVVLEPTDYRGAFKPAPEVAWTEGWTSWTANANAYPATTDNVPAGEITTNTTWTKNKVYNLLGYTFVTNGATLTIEPGTVIRSTAKSALVITRGAKIYANGTKAEPIIFTSNNGIGTRAAGNWGGIVICGAAVHNLASGVDAKVEGDIDARHGGFNDQDSSGVFRYVRIEFPGQALTTQANSELNGLSMYSVGSKTKIEYVQVTNSGDDAYEWFGGTVNAKYLVAINTLDDDFDTDNGYRGTVQFALSQKNPLIADQSGSNGFETDNDANGSLRTPVTAPTFSNITLVGPQGYTSGGSPVTPAALFANAAHIRRNSATSIINSILIGYTESGLSLDGRRTVANAVNGTLKFTNNYLANNTLESGSSNFRLRGTADTMGITSSADVQTWALTLASPVNELGTDNTAGLINPFTFNNPDFRPGAIEVGVEDAIVSSAAEAMLVYPNPATTQVQVAVSKSFANATISIQNAMGATVATQTLTAGLASFDTSNLTNGLYFVTLNNGDKVMSKTVVINR
jgi:hypothetical protein